MGDRLFQELVVSRRGAGPRTGRMIPVSVALHAVGIGALLVAPFMGAAELPVTTHGRITDVWIPRPPQPGQVDTRPAPPRPRPDGGRRRGGGIQVPIETPTLPPEGALVEDVAPPDDSTGFCIGECEPSAPAGDAGPSGDGNGPGTEGPGTGPIRPGGQIDPPRKLHHVTPRYPELAKQAGVGGVVILECVLGKDGRVKEAKVLRGHALLDEAALQAVRQWAYTPTRLNGVPVEVLLTVTVHFHARR